MTHTTEQQQATTAEATPPAATHDIPVSAELRAAIAKDWGPGPVIAHPAPAEAATPTAAHRAALSAALAGQLVVVPAGAPKVRANDTDYPFRADSAFTWLTGETAADAVLVMVPTGSGHDATLFIREFAAPGDVAYFASRQHGALWVGGVPTPTETAERLGVPVRGLSELPAVVGPWRERPAAVLRGVDPYVDALLPHADTAELSRALDELRLVKDEWEIDRLRAACAATARGFADVAREIPTVLAAGGRRGERWLEGTFWRRARLEGNEVGYTSIVGAGAHATTLHWWRNNGDLAEGQLLLADMGVETDELYTADVTRTMPVGGTWTPDQLRVYRAVYEAQEAGIGEVKTGADFAAAHRAAMWVLADHLYSWGILPVPAEVSCAEDPERPGAGLHRRYTLHATSHMLGLDVHDCAQARTEVYKGALQTGYVLTVEPGLYFQPHDQTVPAELRGIGVRIEDDILVTDGAPVNLSDQLPRDADAVTTWMREVQATPARL
jgi:Xaa-Pro aminopeptidase